jgi:hypothetical protein
VRDCAAQNDGRAGSQPGGADSVSSGGRNNDTPVDLGRVTCVIDTGPRDALQRGNDDNQN